MDPRERADELLARARARGSFVVTPDDATSPMDATSTVQIPRIMVAASDPHTADPDSTVILSAETINASQQRRGPVGPPPQQQAHQPQPPHQQPQGPGRGHPRPPLPPQPRHPHPQQQGPPPQPQGPGPQQRNDPPWNSNTGHQQH